MTKPQEITRQKCRCSEGLVWLVHFSGKPFIYAMWELPGCGCGVYPSLIGTITGVVWVALSLVGMIAGAVGAALDVVVPSWLAVVKQNSSEAKPLSCEHLVGVRRFELLTSSVSGKRSPPELNARSRVRECAGNNITELPPSGKNIF